MGSVTKKARPVRMTKRPKHGDSAHDIAHSVHAIDLQQCTVLCTIWGHCTWTLFTNIVKKKSTKLTPENLGHHTLNYIGGLSIIYFGVCPLKYISEGCPIYIYLIFGECSMSFTNKNLLF